MAPSDHLSHDFLRNIRVSLQFRHNSSLKLQYIHLAVDFLDLRALDPLLVRRESTLSFTPATPTALYSGHEASDFAP